MIRMIQRQYIDIYDKSKDPFLIIVDENIVYMNKSACVLFNCLDFERANLSIMGFPMAKFVKTCIAKRKNGAMENVLIAGKSYDVKTLYMDNCLFIHMHREKDVEKIVKDMEFKSRCICAVNGYQKQVFDDALMTVNMASGGDAYKNMFSNIYNRAKKANMTIDELSKSMWCKSDRVVCCNIGMLIQNAVRNTKALLPTADIEVKDMPKNQIAYCELVAMEQAIYSVICAYLYARREEKIQIELSIVNDQVLITMTGKNLKWSKEKMDYVYRRRKEALSTDVHKYGYDILRAANLMEWQSGEILVSSSGDDTKIVLVPSTKRNTNSELIMQSAGERYLTEEDARITLSDIL